ncbi:uracil permease [Treponema sp. OMZ 840]|uniref:hypothetical protein n=1 Tax=Treponema sp. OMZ 840 TaxID=244313 RepID=UPI003D8C92A2
MNVKYGLKRYFSAGDIGAFFGILGDVFSKISVIIGVLLFGEKMPADLVLGRILPGIALGSILGCIIYFWEAYRLSVKEQRDDVTALPFGVSSTQVFTWLFIIIVPIYRQTGDAYLAWSVGLASCFFGGFIEIIGGFVAGFVRRYIPQSALIGNMAAAALVWLSFNGVASVFNKPQIALISLFLAWLTIFRKRNLIPKVPNSVLILIAGALFAWFTKSATSVQVRQAIQNVGVYPPSLFLSDIGTGLSKIAPYLSTIIPLQISNFLATMQAVESADLVGDKYPLRTSMINDGVTTIVSALFGSPFPTTVYYGHPGWKRSGAKCGYLLFMIIPYIMLFFGLPLLIIAVIPFEVIMVFLITVGLTVAMEVQNNLKKDYSIAVYLSLFPIFAQYVVTLLDNVLHTLNTSLTSVDMEAFAAAGIAIKGFMYLANGAFASSLLYSIWIAYIIQKEYVRAAVTCAILAGLSAIGFIHQSALSLLPADNIKFILIYSALALVCLQLHFQKSKSINLSGGVYNED